MGGKKPFEMEGEEGKVTFGEVKVGRGASWNKRRMGKGRGRRRGKSRAGEKLSERLRRV